MVRGAEGVGRGGRRATHRTDRGVAHRDDKEKAKGGLKARGGQRAKGKSASAWLAFLNRLVLQHRWLPPMRWLRLCLRRAATGGDGALIYALDPALPAGLTFNAVTQVIFRTSTEARAATTYALTATDADGDGAILTFTVEVLADLVPEFTATVGPQRYRADRAITPLVLPKATGGNGALTYALVPAPPAGLVLNVATRVLSGTPTAPMPETEYRWAATDEDGDEAELRFTIAIEVSDRTRIGAINQAVLPELSRAIRRITG